VTPERFSASVAGRHIACHASANLPLAIPNWVDPEVDETIDNAANRGTAVHSIFELIWEHSAKDIAHMARVMQYVANLRSTRRFKVMIEEKVEATWLPHPTKTTADLVLYTQDEIHVIDTKWGAIEVPVVGNEQLLFYAACYAPLAPRAKGVTLHILQPKCDNLEQWYVSATDIKKFMDEAVAAQTAILNGSIKFGPSDHCKFCPANPHSRGLKGRPLCPTMMKMLYPQPFDEDEILGI